ncbi:MAG: nucleotidyl transferase AbiEii/AbiGii toxin family protein [Candidatus Muiribacteriota bacterium]
MYKLDKNYISKKASELGFIRDTLEKVYRLIDILEYINNEPFLKMKLALKGGTAINLSIFNLPRLSVDIDLDYVENVSREEMLKNRENINNSLCKFIEISGYKLSPKSKRPFSLDSWVIEYENLGGNRDNIKIEINYSLRTHIFPAKKIEILNKPFSDNFKLNCLNVIEIFASKINALLNRGAARDLYDIYNMIKFKIFDEIEREYLRKCIIFYHVISTKGNLGFFDIDSVDKILQQKIRTDLLPVLTNRDLFDLNNGKRIVKDYLIDLLVLTPSEIEFINRFKVREYNPELLFDDSKILNRISKHPMALWKTKNKVDGFKG